jgi:DNA mismatch endonuclease (patch repair protein)
MATIPKTRTDFWMGKFEANVARDLRNETALLDAGWRVVVVWACRIGKAPSDGLVEKLVDFVKSGKEARLEIG